MLMSYMGGTGEVSAPKKISDRSADQTLTSVLGTSYDDFFQKKIEDIEAFQLAILDLFSTVNMAVPGRHYDPPSPRKVEEFYEQWKNATTEEDQRREKLIRFMLDNVNLNKVDKTLVITGIVAPPAAMVAKKTGQTVPQLRVMKSIPDVIFVPSATILAVILVKFSRIRLMKIVAPK